MCRRFDTIPACDRQTDRRTDGTDGIAVANTALAMRALRAVKMNKLILQFGLCYSILEVRLNEMLLSAFLELSIIW